MAISETNTYPQTFSSRTAEVKSENRGELTNAGSPGRTAERTKMVVVVMIVVTVVDIGVK